MPQNASLIQLIFWLVGGCVTGGLGFLGLRYTTRAAARASTSLNAELWNARYRHAAERHLRWDYRVRTDHELIKAELNRTRAKQGEPPLDWPDLPEPPPLFPRPEDDDTP